MADLTKEQLKRLRESLINLEARVELIKDIPNSDEHNEESDKCKYLKYS